MYLQRGTSPLVIIQVVLFFNWPRPRVCKLFGSSFTMVRSLNDVHRLNLEVSYSVILKSADTRMFPLIKRNPSTCNIKCLGSGALDASLKYTFWTLSNVFIYLLHIHLSFRRQLLSSSGTLRASRWRSAARGSRTPQQLVCTKRYESTCFGQERRGRDGHRHPLYALFA